MKKNNIKYVITTAALALVVGLAGITTYVHAQSPGATATPQTEQNDKETNDDSGSVDSEKDVETNDDKAGLDDQKDGETNNDSSVQSERN